MIGNAWNDDILCFHYRHSTRCNTKARVECMKFGGTCFYRRDKHAHANCRSQSRQPWPVAVAKTLCFGASHFGNRALMRALVENYLHGPI